MKNTAVSPPAAMTIPATPGPAILASPVTVANRELPRRSSPGPTRSSMSVCPACRPWVIIATRAARCRATMIPARRLNSRIGRH
jgi:hypothetical protein